MEWERAGVGGRLLESAHSGELIASVSIGLLDDYLRTRGMLRNATARDVYVL